MLLIVLQPLSVNKRNRVYNKMAVQVLGVQVGSNYNLKSVAPHTLGKFCSYLLCQFGVIFGSSLKLRYP